MLQVVNYIVAVIGSACMYFSILILSGVKYRKREFLLFTFFTSVLTGAVKNIDYSNTPISILKIFIFYIAIAFATRKFVKLNTSKAFLYTTFCYSITLIVDSIASLIMFRILEYDLQAFRSDVPLLIIYNLVVFNAVILIAQTIRIILDKYLEGIDYSKNAVIVLYSSTTFIIAVLNVMVYNKCFQYMGLKVLYMSIFTMVSYFVMTLALLKYNSLLILKEQENEQLNIYIKMSDELINEYRRIRHNTVNLIEASSEYIETENMQGLKELLEDTIQRHIKIKKSNYMTLNKIFHPGIKSLLYSKLGKAEEASVSMDIDIQTDMHSIAIKISHLCEILGIFLDNALEAAELSDEKRIEVCVFEADDYYVVIIENSFGEIISKGANRGTGLKVAQSIIKKYQYVLLNTSIERNIYKQELNIKKIYQMDNILK